MARTFFGTSQLKKCFVGTENIKRIWVGTDLVFQDRLDIIKAGAIVDSVNHNMVAAAVGWSDNYTSSTSPTITPASGYMAAKIERSSTTSSCGIYHLAKAIDLHGYDQLHYDCEARVTALAGNTTIGSGIGIATRSGYVTARSTTARRVDFTRSTSFVRFTGTIDITDSIANACDDILLYVRCRGDNAGATITSYLRIYNLWLE